MQKKSGSYLDQGTVGKKHALQTELDTLRCYTLNPSAPTSGSSLFPMVDNSLCRSIQRNNFNHGIATRDLKEVEKTQQAKSWYDTQQRFGAIVRHTPNTWNSPDSTNTTKKGHCYVTHLEIRQKANSMVWVTDDFRPNTITCFISRKCNRQLGSIKAYGNNKRQQVVKGSRRVSKHVSPELSFLSLVTQRVREWLHGTRHQWFDTLIYLIKKAPENTPRTRPHLVKD